MACGDRLPASTLCYTEAVTGGTDRNAACRPTVAIVLAAGRSERLHEVTGGGSKALIRVGGLTLVERAARTLLAAGVERLIVAGFEHAKRHGVGVVHMADKSNAMKHAHELWYRCFFEVAKEYPGIEPRHVYVDAMCLYMVQDPSQFWSRRTALRSSPP